MRDDVRKRWGRRRDRRGMNERSVLRGPEMGTLKRPRGIVRGDG